MRNRQHEVLSARVITRLHPSRNWNASQYQPPSNSKKFRKWRPSLANSSALILYLCSLEIEFFPGQLDGHVNTAQPVYFRFRILPKRTTLVTLARK